MAEPLSVSASLVSLITFAEILFRRTFKYAKAVRNAPEEIRKLSEEISILHGLLHRVELLASELEGHHSQTSIQNYGLSSCLKTLEKIKSILDKFEAPTTANKTLNKVKRRLGWPFSTSEANSLIDEIGRHKATLGLALTADEMSGLVNILAKQAGLSDRLQGIERELVQRREVETRVQLDEERRKILYSFGTTTPELNHDMSLQLRQSETGLWLTEGAEFQDWLATPGTGLWLYGIPGAGKTVLAASIIEKAVQRSSDRVAVAFYYCDYKDIETQSPRNILGALVKQIAKQDEQSFKVLRTFYQQHHRADRSPNVYEESELSALVIEMAAFFETTMIIVDALDECGKGTRTVTKLLARLRSSNADSNIKTLFLSRDEVEIRDVLDDYPQVSIAARSSDLKLYVGAEMARRISDKELRIKDHSLKEHIIERLTNGADGM